MPWQEVTRVSLRQEFVVLALQPGNNRRELCRRFGVAPKTGDKWLARYAREGLSGRPRTSVTYLSDPRPKGKGVK